MVGDEDAAAARNETYKHLEDPLRLSGLRRATETL